MWFEARKQERKIRSVMIDHKKRQERRRNFYERIRKDPTDFMQLHGRRCKIYVDPAIAQAAESAAILRPWQGDPQVLIDRFDARSHLDTIVEYPSEGPERNATVASSEEQREERRANFERYRVLVLNEFDKTSEEKYLKQIYINEFFGGVLPHHDDKKKKPVEQKAAIAYTYEDSTGPTFSGSKGGKNASGDEDGDSDDELDEDELADELLQTTERRVDIASLSKDQCKALNEVAGNYSVVMGDFTKFMWEDYEEETILEQMKEVEQEKANLSGKQSRRERKMLKEMHARMRGRYDKAPSYFGLIQPLRDEKLQKGSHGFPTGDDSSDSSSDSSRNTSPDGKSIGGQESIQYITSFGGDDKQQSSRVTRTDATSSRTTARSPSSSSTVSSKERHQTERHQDTSDARPRHTRSRSRSRNRHYGRGHSKGGRYAGARRRHDSPSERRSSKKSSRRGYRRSSSSSSSSRSPQTSHSKKGPPVGTSTSRASDHKNARSSDSESELSMLSVRSSMSGSEQERRQIENTKRRLKNTKRKVRSGAKLDYSYDNSAKGTAAKGKALSLRERLALQTQKALKKTVARDKEEETKRREELLREQFERDEEMREMTNLIRQKEREKRDREVEEEVKAEWLTREQSGDRRSESKKRSSSRSSSRSFRRRRNDSRSRRSRRSRSQSHSRSRSRKRSNDRRRDDHHWSSRRRSRSRSRTRRSHDRDGRKKHDRNDRQHRNIVSSRKLVDY